jgi:hypothetical protein
MVDLILSGQTAGAVVPGFRALGLQLKRVRNDFAGCQDKFGTVFLA